MIEWSEAIAVGVEAIDEEHREFIRRINRLLDAIKNDTDRDEVISTIYFLEEYAMRHFRSERNLMRDNAYPGTERHLRLHDDFILEVFTLKMRLSEGGVTEGLFDEVTKKVSEWFVNHIRVEDVALGAHIKKGAG